MMKQKANGRIFIAFLLSAAIVVSMCVPASAKEVGNSEPAVSGTCELTEGCVLEEGHEGDCKVPSEDDQTIGKSEDDKSTHGEDDGADQENHSSQSTDAKINTDQQPDGADMPTGENKERAVRSSKWDKVYPGEEETKDGKTVWVAYDEEYASTQPEEATVKATVTLPENVTVPAGYKLFIRQMNSGEEFFPSEAEVKKKVMEYNEYQCYMIRWVDVSTLDDPDVPAKTKSMSDILGGNVSKNVSIKIDYLKEEAKLEGPAGARKLLIFNSTRDGKLLDTVSDSVTDVNISDTQYNSFTFNTHQTGPYVFVSKHVEKGYIKGLTVEQIEDGFEPFDQNDSPGNDSGNNNKIVRSYDTIQYELAITFGGRQIEAKEKSVNVYFELSIKKSATAARFDTTKMLWLKDNYSIEYLNKDKDVVMIQTHKGKFCQPKRDEDDKVIRDEHGFAQADESKEVSFNAQLNGSTSGPNSYKVSTGGIEEQKLTGWTTLSDEETGNILNATKSLSAAVEVRNADNGETFQPSFKMWLEGNEDNYGPEGGDGNEMIPAQPCTDNFIPSEKVTPIKVSAGTNFNLQLKKNTDMSYKNWFDFSTGDVVAKEVQTRLDELADLENNRGKSNPAEFVDENGAALDETTKKKYENYRYGRITCYGITLQLYNDTEPETNRASKGLKGLSLPVGDIEFDLNFSSTVLSQGQSFEGAGTEYPAILWDYNENIPAENSYSYTYKDPGRGKVTTPKDGKGNGGRRIYWDGETRSSYAKGGGPSNYIAYHDGCYYGGDWALMNGDTKVNSLTGLSEVAHPNKVTGTGKDTTYHFAVNDYDFDFDNHHFPYRDAGNSGGITGYDTYARCFSAGCVQVLSVFPRVQKESSANIDLTAAVKNLKLTTRAGQELKAADDDATGYQHEVNKGDNKRTDAIVVYAPGNLTKGSAFNGKYKDQPPETTTQGFLGTDYWTTNYDCSAFAGDEIWIMSYGMMSSGSDFHTKSMNLLQIFDSRALSIRDEPTVHRNLAEGNTGGEVKFLYAADPDHPEGYDTNREDMDMVAYMNTVREEDLVYSETMPDNDGYITVGGTSEKLKCIGVLMEIRGCDLLGGLYQYFSIPVKVNGEDESLVGKTVATVNTFRTWSYDIGENITWSKGHWTEGKNVLDGYPNLGETDPEKYSGELANVEGKLIYTKTEYEDGQKKTDSHGGGTLAGNSLLILGYKAHLNIGVDNKSSESGSYIYNQDNNETIVDYRLKNIKTEISDHTGQSESPKTKLTVRTVLDENNSTGKERISIAGDSYKMQGQTISSDSANPTSITFTASDQKTYTITVYAKLGTTGRDVTFVIDNAPVGVQLPDITFQANFASIRNLENNDGIRTSAYISGTGDNRAYSTTNGNVDNVTVNVVLSGGTSLDKAVHERYIELSDVIHYDVTYTNGGSTAMNKVYFYDLLPFSGDIRDSRFSGDVILRSFGVKSSGDPADAANATVYYSTTEYWELYETVNVFGGAGTPQEKETAVEKMLAEGKNKKGDKLFQPLGEVKNGEFEYTSELTELQENNPGELIELLTKIEGLYVKAENLKSKQTITLSFAIETTDNQAGDFYRNISNSWIAGSGTLPLKSTRVETAVVSRSISGVVWYDWNLNGIRDEDVEKEKPIKDVEVTLFKKNDSGTYEPCTEDKTGQPIDVVNTGEDGAYSFERLAQGEYIVAFSGEALKPYTDATFYQQNGKNDSNTSDGKTSDELGAEGIDKAAYPYFIKYSADAENMTLHSIDDIRKGGVELNNYKEDINHQDLGVIVAGYELPETGGRGTIPYTAGGILLIMAAFLTYGFTDRRRQYR